MFNLKSTDMKTFKLLFLIGVLCGILSGCSKDDELLNQDDELANALKSKKIPTQFSGICTPIDNMGYGIISWYLLADK